MTRGDIVLARQRALVALQEAIGGKVECSKALLASFEETQRLHIADRNRLREELNQAKMAGRDPQRREGHACCER